MNPDIGGETKYADGFAEYGSFYGGPAFTYLTPSKSASSTIHELPADNGRFYTRHPPGGVIDESYTSSPHTHRQRHDAEGLQPVHEMPRPSYSEGLEVNVRHRDLPNKQIISRRLPSPAEHIHHNPRTHFGTPHSPITPTSPVSPVGLPLQQPTDTLNRPQPLHFTRRPDVVPPTPPMSYGSTVSSGDALTERMQSLHMSSDHYDVSRNMKHPGMLSGNLMRSNTTSSWSSGAPSMTNIPYDESVSVVGQNQRHRHSSAFSTTSSRDSAGIEQSSNKAHIELLNRLKQREGNVKSKDATSSSLKKGFSFRRTNTAPKSVGPPSQEALTDILEEVAEEGNVELVKAVLAAGADPVYRSNGKLKKVKHEALVKASNKGHATVVDFLLRKGATFGDAAKKGTYSAIDRALLTAAYNGHKELVQCLIQSHGANPLIEQWPREMHDTQFYWAENQVRLAKTSVLDAISHWSDVDESMEVLRTVMQHPNFVPTALVAGVFDTKSELQSAEFGHRPWQTTYAYSALSCFVRAGWADAVEEMLQTIGSIKDFEQEDEILQYQDKITRYISPMNALTKDTWEKRPEDALRILKLLIDRRFNLRLAQRSATDMGVRTVLGRAIAADAAQAVELILQHDFGLVREEVWFRRSKKETKALPLAAALSLGSLDSARVLLRSGAHPRDPAFDGMNVLQFTAYQGGDHGPALLKELIDLAPELTYNALEIAITRVNNDIIRVLLDSISAAAVQGLIAELPPVYDMLLRCTGTDQDLKTKKAYLELIEMISIWDSGNALQRPQLPSILSAIRADNFLGMSTLLEMGIVDGTSLGLNSKAQLPGEQGSWTMLECCEMTDRSAQWLGLLRNHGAPLYH